MEDFYNYLMFEMAFDINSELESNSEKAHELCFVLSLSYDPIPETFFRLYCSGTDVPPEYFINALAFFQGANLLSVFCDCSPQDKHMCEIYHSLEGPFFEAGQKAVAEKEDIWLELDARIHEMRHVLEMPPGSVPKS
jgi:hypothetical protein